ncbi:MAG: hypothetical protein Q7T10_07940 [Rhodoferax sp.]|uniref:hypothetical protein n=1 Tax=Rhodoferax sp. TaxID=50421 RepID=UPI00271FD010|nr:hypothetical protein [Rhodoferax sp.]MDO8448723.1 hypothetical protein [Rhodoferax sp.]
MTDRNWPAEVSFKLMAAAEFAYLHFPNQSLATLWRHFAFNGDEREKAQKIALSTMRSL